MNSKKKKSYRQILIFLKKEFKLEFVKNKRFNLKKYSIIEKGEYLKVMSYWKLTGFNLEAYLLNIRNSYVAQESGSVGESFIPVTFENKNSAIIIRSKYDFPEVIIRPAKTRDRLANVFLNFDIKLSGRKLFNRKYILESNSNQILVEKFISKNITNELIKHQEFNLESKKNSILFKFEREFNQEDVIKLIKIGEIIEKEIKTLHNTVYN